MPTAAKTYKESCQEFVEQYRGAGEPWPATARDVAAWAIRKRLWQPSMRSSVSILAGDIADAMREEYIEDPQGRRIRRKHPRREKVKLASGETKQLTFWDDITTASPEHMHVSFQQRRRGVLGDCHQMKVDNDSYNENWNSGEPIKLSYDFTEDLAEMEMPTDYDGEKFGEDDGDESP